jgi:NADPH:quinone reductase-like Zn-dependent oxidoreductase
MKLRDGNVKALALNGYDGLTSLRIETCAPRPLGPSDVRIDVHAASVNPVDARITGGYLRGRVDFELPHVLGRDCSGIVQDVGSDVTGFKPGDAVIAVADQKRWGTHADQVVIDQSTVARKPDELSHVEAASLLVAGLSALAGLATTGKVQRGERILIHAGAGGVGSFAVQLGKHLGAFVAATAGPTNAEYVRQLGADVVVDYTAQDFSGELTGYDLVFDVFGADVRYRSFRVLRPGGRIVHLSSPPMTQPAPRDDVTVTPASVGYETRYLDQLSALVAAKAVRPTVTRVFPFLESVTAYELIRSGHARGKIVIDMKR